MMDYKNKVDKMKDSYKKYDNKNINPKNIVGTAKEDVKKALDYDMD